MCYPDLSSLPLRWRKIFAIECIHQSWTILVRRISHQFHMNLYWIDVIERAVSAHSPVGTKTPRGWNVIWRELMSDLARVPPPGEKGAISEASVLSYKRARNNHWNEHCDEWGWWPHPLPAAQRFTRGKGSFAIHNKRLENLTPFDPIILLLMGTNPRK